MISNLELRHQAELEEAELTRLFVYGTLVAGIAPGWRFIPAGGKTPSIDGYIQIRDQIRDPTFRNYLNLAVQVKSGRSCFHVPKRQMAKFGYLDVKPSHVNQWKTSNIPVIVVWDEEPTSIDARVLWTQARHAKALEGNKISNHRKHEPRRDGTELITLLLYSA